MHPHSIEIFEKFLVEIKAKQLEPSEQEKFINEMVSEEKVPNYEMAKLLFDEAHQLILIYQRGVIDGIKKVIEKDESGLK